MHEEARAAVQRIATRFDLTTRPGLTVLDLGGRNINGSLRDLFADPDWTALDATPGEGVDVVADARTWRSGRLFDVVLCTEVFEHLEGWERVLETAFRALRDDGVFIVTCASTSRPPHGMSGGPWPEPGEHYRNVPPAELLAALADEFPSSFGLEYAFPPGDLYAWGRR